MKKEKNMSLLGSGVIAIWNDITDEGRANFYEWHDREQVVPKDISSQSKSIGD